MLQASQFVAAGCCGALALLLSACGSSDQAEAPPPEAAVKASQQASAPTKNSNPLANMVKAVPAATGTQPVELRYELPKPPVLGEPFDVNFNVLGLADASGLELKVTLQRNVEVIAGGEKSLGALQTGESVSHTLQLRATATGISVIDVQLVATVAGTPGTAAFAIPVALPAESDAATATAAK